MPTKSKLLLAAALTFALPALPAAAAGEPAKSQSDSAKGTHKDKKSDKPAKQPVMLPQPATTDPMPAIDLSRFGDKPADEAFGAFQRGLYLTAFNLAKARDKDSGVKPSCAAINTLSYGSATADLF